MEIISIKAKSSSDEPYAVDFIIQNKKMVVTCDCRAGEFGKLCKHKVELINGDKDRLFDINEQEKLEKLQLIIANISDFAVTAKSIETSEKIIRQEKRNLSKLKKNFEKKLKNGVEI